MLSNHQSAKFRIGLTIGILAVCTICAMFGLYPSNYESLFTPINSVLSYFVFGCMILAIICLIFGKSKIQTNVKPVSNVSYYSLVVTLGLGFAFFSYAIDPNMIKNSPMDSREILMIWYGPAQWSIFVPALLLEIAEAKGLLPKVIVTIKRYLYAVTMMLAIGISLMVGCTSLPKIIYGLTGVSISPYLLMMPIAGLIAISLLRGVHKGMKIFSNVTMVSMLIIAVAFSIIGWTNGNISRILNLIYDAHTHTFSILQYHGTEFEIKYQSPYWIWAITWMGIIAPFIHRISTGRSLREVITYVLIAPSITCSIYLAIIGSSDHLGLSTLSSSSLLSMTYIIMLVLMFVTSADSTCESIDECISKGSKIPMTYRKLMWIFIMCIFITILMICGNGSMDAIYGICGVRFN